MNRFSVYCTLILLFASLSGCVKKQIVVNRLEGTWTYTKKLLKDGSYEYYSERTVTFCKGDADGKTFLDLVNKANNVETNGKYLVDKRAQKIYIMPDVNFPNAIDSLTIEDMDKNSLVARTVSGIQFYDKN